MNVLNSTTFNPDTIMPICLPPSVMFQDTNRHAVAVGMSKRKQSCFTDASGPDVFQKCAFKWISPDENGNIDGNGKCSFHEPPSAQDKVCKTFHKRIAELKYDVN